MDTLSQAQIDKFVSTLGTEEQIRRQYRRNAEDFVQMADRAIRTGKKVGGYRAGELVMSAIAFDKKAETFRNVTKERDALKETLRTRDGVYLEHRESANTRIETLQSVNAELLVALKASANRSYQFDLTPYKGDTGERWVKYEQRVSEMDYNKIQALIAKAEGRS